MSAAQTEDTGFTAPQSAILVVDDTPSVIDYIRTVLEKEGYRLFIAKEGQSGVARAAAVNPDLILLDVMMPGLDGYAACRRLKADPRTADIPVVFISALASGFDKSKAFEAVAADYITKPVDPLELLARVRAQLSLAELEKRRKRDAAELETLVAARTAELRSALDEKEGYLRELSHRVKNNLQLLTAIIEEELASYSGETRGLVALRGRVETMALVYEQLQTEGRHDGVALDEYLRSIAYAVVGAHPGRRLDITFELERVFLRIDEAMPCGLIVHELVENAAEHAYGLEGGPIRLRLFARGEECHIEIADEGRGCHEALSYEGPGLGFKFIRALAAQLNGSLHHEEGEGCRLSLRFKSRGLRSVVPPA